MVNVDNVNTVSGHGAAKGVTIMAKATGQFVKGQAVTYIASWDDKGTSRFVHLTVHSCGAKQMVLVDDAGVKFAGCNFRPQTVQGDTAWYAEHNPGALQACGLVMPRMTDDEARAAAKVHGAGVAAYEKAAKEERIAVASAADYQYRNEPSTPGYIAAMRDGIAALNMEGRAVSAAEATAEVAARIAARAR